MINQKNNSSLFERCRDLTDSPTKLFEELHNVWCTEINDDETASGQALANLHNNGHGCAFSLATAALPDFDSAFDVIHVLEKAVPLFDILNIDAVFDFEKAVHDTVKNDLAGGILRNKYMTRFESNPKEALEVIDKFLKAPAEETGATFRAALIGLATYGFDKSFEVAIDAAGSSDFFVAANAISALGAFDWTITGRLSKLREFLRVVNEHAGASDSELSFVSAMALSEIVAKKPKLHPQLYRLGQSGSKDGLAALVDFLWRNKKEYCNEPWFLELLEVAAQTPVNHGRSIRNLDFVLSELLRDDDIEFDVELWLAVWLGSQTDDNIPVDIPKIFPSTFRQLLSAPNILGSIFTAWLIHENLRYPSAVHEMAGKMSVMEVKELSFDLAAVATMDEQDLLHLSRRTLGWVFSASIRISLMWSLTAVKNASGRTYSIVQSIFSDYLGYEYPIEVEEYLEPIRDTSKEKKLIALCDNILASMKSYQKALDRLEKVKELRSSPEQYRLFQKARYKEMRKAKEEAEKDSLILQMANSVSVLAGNGTFYRMQDGSGYSDKSFFTSVGTSMTIPRSAIINTVGSEHQRLLMRCSQRGEK